MRFVSFLQQIDSMDETTDGIHFLCVLQIMVFLFPVKWDVTAGGP